MYVLSHIGSHVIAYFIECCTLKLKSKSNLAQNNSQLNLVRLESIWTEIAFNTRGKSHLI